MFRVFSENDLIIFLYIFLFVCGLRNIIIWLSTSRNSCTEKHTSILALMYKYEHASTCIYFKTNRCLRFPECHMHSVSLFFRWLESYKEIYEFTHIPFLLILNFTNPRVVIEAHQLPRARVAETDFIGKT